MCEVRPKSCRSERRVRFIFTCHRCLINRRHFPHDLWGVQRTARSCFILLTILPSQTSPSTQSVHLIGSWDNFSKHYPMERDIRRARGQWRGCYSFEDIICDGDGGSSPKRSGGLKMGSTYYYYVCFFYPKRKQSLTFLYSMSWTTALSILTSRYHTQHPVLTYPASPSIRSLSQLKFNLYVTAVHP